MPPYKVTLTDTESRELQQRIQKGGKGYRIKHVQILRKLDENRLQANMKPLSQKAEQQLILLMRLHLLPALCIPLLRR